MRWMLNIFAYLVRYVVGRKGWWWGIVVIICGVGICVAFYWTITPRDVTYPNARVAREYQQHLAYLMRALAESPPDFSGIRSGLYGSTIAVVEREDFPLFTRKLRYTLYKAAADPFVFHLITVGGMEVRDIDQALLDATKRLRMDNKPNIEIVIVAPSTISDQTKRVLEKKGLRVRLIDVP